MSANGLWLTEYLLGAVPPIRALPGYQLFKGSHVPSQHSLFKVHHPQFLLPFLRGPGFQALVAIRLSLSDRHSLYMWSEQVPELDCSLLSMDPPLSHLMQSKPWNIFQK